MEKKWKIFENIKKHSEAGSPGNSYYKIIIPFEISCNKCGNKASVYQKYEFAYGQNPVIKCNECENEEELYGVDG